MEESIGEYMKVAVVGMIYKSVEWLQLMVSSVEKYCPSTEDYEVTFTVIANDANETVLNYLKEHNINHLVYNDPKPEDYYLNRVYRAWNFGGYNADGDVVVFINSDMVFSKNWLENLIHCLTPDTIPCSLLVESGKLPSGQNAISKNFGQDIRSFREDLFETFVEQAGPLVDNKVLDGGLYMPCAFYKEDFIKAGGYPEGNIYHGGEGMTHTGFIRSGDDHFFHHNEVMKQKAHITVMDSIVYHFQTGEMDS